MVTSTRDRRKALWSGAASIIKRRATGTLPNAGHLSLDSRFLSRSRLLVSDVKIYRSTIRANRKLIKFILKFSVKCLLTCFTIVAYSIIFKRVTEHWRVCFNFIFNSSQSRSTQFRQDSLTLDSRLLFYHLVPLKIYMSITTSRWQIALEGRDEWRRPWSCDST